MMKSLNALFLFLSLMIFAPSGLAHEMENPPAPDQSSQQAAPEPQEPEASRWFGNVALILGGQQMFNSAWKDRGADQQESTEINADLGAMEWPVNLYVGAVTGSNGSSDSSWSSKYRVSSVVIGPRRYFGKQGAVRSYLSGGVALISLDRDGGGGDRNANLAHSRGFFINGGAFWKLGRFFNLGLDVTLTAGGKMDGKSDSNHARAGLLLGFGS